MRRTQSNNYKGGLIHFKGKQSQSVSWCFKALLLLSSAAQPYVDRCQYVKLKPFDSPSCRPDINFLLVVSESDLAQVFAPGFRHTNTVYAGYNVDDSELFHLRTGSLPYRCVGAWITCIHNNIPLSKLRRLIA